MLSILIPTYNYDCYDLVKELHRQATELNIEFEIIVADDCSQTYKEKNKLIKLFSHTTYIELDKNIGRSKIRNFLADTAIYPYLLFMDCDSEVSRKDYISKYIKHCEPNCCIIGGTSYDPKENNPKYSLRLKYGRLREANDNYTKRFVPFNFLIAKDLFNKIRFNESIRGYGHEDSLFGAELKQHTNYINIDNPLIHKGLDENNIFLQKTETATKNLWILTQNNKHKYLIQESSLLQAYYKLKKLHIVNFINILFSITRPILKKQLTSKNPSLFLFDCYKIGYLCHISTKT